MWWRHPIVLCAAVMWIAYSVFEMDMNDAIRTETVLFAQFNCVPINQRSTAALVPHDSPHVPIHLSTLAWVCVLQYTIFNYYSRAGLHTSFGQLFHFIISFLVASAAEEFHSLENTVLRRRQNTAESHPITSHRPCGIGAAAASMKFNRQQ